MDFMHEFTEMFKISYLPFNGDYLFFDLICRPLRNPDNVSGKIGAGD
jgi:hypothetical protein